MMMLREDRDLLLMNLTRMRKIKNRRRDAK
jgi:hypothetical protein